MNLYIQVENGQAKNHPLLEENLLQVFPNIDVNNLPPNFAKFIRKPKPEIGVYEVYEGIVYEREGDAFADVHQVREMTLEEKIEKQNKEKERWATLGFPSWTFNETTCSFDSPIPYPTDGKNYYWDENITNWVEITT